MEDHELKSLILEWYEHGREASISRLFGYLYSWSNLPAGFLRSLGESETQDLKMEVLEKLLDRSQRRLEDIENPHAFIKMSLYNKGRDALRKQRTRLAFLENSTPSESPAQNRATEDIVSQLDGLRVLEAAKDLEFNYRMAIFLTLAPQIISQEEWLQLQHSPPPHLSCGFDRDEASAALLGRSEPEDRQSRRRRLEHFRKILERATDKLRRQLRETT